MKRAMTWPERLSFRSPIVLAGVVFVALAAIAVALVYAASWRAKVHASAGSAGGAAAPGFAWLSEAMNACEKEAARNPKTLYFMVVPLAPTASFGEQIKLQALETVGAATLFASKVALDGLDRGALRISTEQFILHSLDTGTSAIHRWKSAVGVSTLTKRENISPGPFKIRLQTTPNDPAEWSNVTADGTASCHWVFALLRH